MSDLDDAVRAAVESLDGRGTTSSHATPSGPRVAVVQKNERALPPIQRRAEPLGFVETVRQQCGDGAVAALTGLRELAVLFVCFWLASVPLSFVEQDSVVVLGGQAYSATMAALVGAVLLRLVLLLAHRASSALESGRG